MIDANSITTSRITGILLNVILLSRPPIYKNKFKSDLGKSIFTFWSYHNVALMITFYGMIHIFNPCLFINLNPILYKSSSYLIICILVKLTHTPHIFDQGPNNPLQHPFLNSQQGGWRHLRRSHCVPLTNNTLKSGASNFAELLKTLQQENQVSLFLS